MKTILITAYAVNPFKGSEDGTGWNISKEIARFNKVIVITRKNNRAEIERYLAQHEDPIHANMQFDYFDLPWWAMFWKKKLGERGYVLYFYLWQLFMPFFIKRRNFEFDATHSLNFHSDSHPHFLWVFSKPSFWGPIGHHPPVPKEFILPVYGFKDYAKDRIYNSIKWIMRNMDPFFHICKWRTKKIFVINSGVPKTIGCSSDKCVVIPAIATETNEYTNQITDRFNVISVGRFVYMKGFDITIRAFADFYHRLKESEKVRCTLTLVGKGEALPKLKKIASDCKISHAIKWIDWVDKSEMDTLYESSDVFLFPSHEGAGMVVAEAMSKGLPVVCFDNVGPGELAGEAGFAVPYTTYRESIRAFAETLNWLFEFPELREEVAHCGLARAMEEFSWQRKGILINGYYNDELLQQPIMKLKSYSHE